jgi:choline kinase
MDNFHETTIILSAGESIRFDEVYPKQHIEIQGERIIDRTLRLFPNAYLVAVNPNIAPYYPKIFIPKANRYTSETLLSTQSLWEYENTILFGDVYYTEKTVDIIKKSSNPITFFSDGQDIFALKFKKEQNISKYLEEVIRKAKEPDGNFGRIWELYRLMFGMHQWPAVNGMPALSFIGDQTQDFDTVEDLENFRKGISKNILFNK